MKVSIITVCYNSAKTIRDTIESVINQTYKNVEYILVDGASNDETLAIIEEYGDRISIIVSEKDNGIYDAMNKGISLATGDIVGILNSDDFFADEGSLAAVVSGFSNNVDAIYADLVYVNQGITEKVSRVYSSKRFKKWKIRFGFMVPHPTFYARRHLFESHGYYKLNYRVAADFELITRFVKSGVRFNRVDKVIVKMREGGVSSRGLLGRLQQNVEIARACRENGIFSLSIFMLIKLPFKLATYFQRYDNV